jgi:putative peptidoglycan lipid II flippase
MRALFARGAFTSADAVAAGHTLAAYALGLIPFVLIRSVVATFFARGDTANPVKAALIASGVNIAFKIVLVGSLAQVGLALATSIGAWINLGLVMWLAVRANLLQFDPDLRRSVIKIGAAGLALAMVLWFGESAFAGLFREWTALRDEAVLAALALTGGLIYGGIVTALLGRRWFAAFRGSVSPPVMPDGNGL